METIIEKHGPFLCGSIGVRLQNLEVFNPIPSMRFQFLEEIASSVI